MVSIVQCNSRTFSARGMRRIAVYVCVLAILSTTVIVTYICSHTTTTNYSTRNTVLFDDRNAHRLSSNNLQLSSHSVIKQYLSTDTATLRDHDTVEAHAVQIEDSKS